MFGIKNRKQHIEITSQKISWGHWFTFFNIIWAIIIGSRYAFIIDWPDTFFGKFYFFISLLGHFGFIIFAFYLIILFPLSFLVKNERTFRGISVIFSTLGMTLLILDTEVFARFHLHLSSLVWNLLVNPENGELSRNWQLFFTPMPFILLIQMLFSRWSWNKLRSLERQKWLKPIGLLFVCNFIATHFIYAWADAYIYRPITMQKSNFPLSYPMTARTFLESHGLLDKEKYNQKISDEGRPDALKLNYPKSSLVFDERTEKTNILFITINGLRYDAITPDAMPKLSEFAETATNFVHHYSSGNNTNNALAGLFYGLNANYTDSLLSYKIPSIFIEKLRQEKYQMGLFFSPTTENTLLKQAVFSKEKKINHNTNGVEFIRWYQQAKNKSQALFAYLNYHIPENLTQSEYVMKLMEIDNSIDQILKEIDLNNTLVLITSEKGYLFEEITTKHKNYFSQDLIRVPMIIHWKNLQAAQITELTSHTDLLPSLMIHLFNITNPPSDYSQGIDLFNTKKNRHWVHIGNYRWNVIVTENDMQYHIDKRGNYQKYDRTYQKMSSDHPPLGLFLDVFKQDSAFIEK
ncbi:hypothetical protein EV697_104190 [Bisgaardia hudsonensis]|uniref:Inner membrane protein YejM N-terminal domain-containing protein n=1 Tax=Bisgaardia hudsonensis TaxID=109472 RepID=A0A4R2MX59_9PAST|nr:DUF3413 domain-containing protein [Bisgaardia hudsonensis]QLB12328.1 hypothetical protein A6A11_01210 [Bisgaardia hudsonensis]TCP12375.1 hypothetical protein EV697_104190 [Bisgaardia hudsonensis]